MNGKSAYYFKFFPVGSAFFAALTACIIYFLTADSSVSYWDCPEYVATASSLQVGHPPGNPIWTLTMRMATIPFSPEVHARVINLCSAFLMALAVFFLVRITFYFIYKVLIDAGKKSPILSPGIIMLWSSIASAVIGLCFAVLDSTWFSAVEAEVYAFSTFLTAFTIWLMLRWTRSDSGSRQRRLLILTAYILGLSLGVHQLNLLCLPVLGLIFTFHRYPDRSVVVRGWLAVAISFLITGAILLLFMPGTIASAAIVELIAVNKFKLPYFSGVIIYPAIVISVFVLALWLLRRHRNMTTALWMVGMLWVGYSAVALLLIRGYAATPINEAAPSDIFSLQRYIDREQYGSKPLFYGPTPYSRPVFIEEWQNDKDMPVYSRYLLEKEKPRYIPFHTDPHLLHRSRLLSHDDSTDNKAIISEGHGYILSDYKFRRVTTPELDMWLPRITSTVPNMLDSYEDWTGMNQNNMMKVGITTAIDTTGKFVGKLTPSGERLKETALRPTYLQNLKYFISYQVTYMYLRYLLWNFMGRQNDIPSTGEIEHGNFITGIPPIDDMMLGKQSLMPSSASYDNPGRHVYYGIPFLLGILGIIFLMRSGREGKRMMALVTLFFFMTGLAIVIYLNQNPGEPRERDYAFIGSYMAFCIWIAFGLIYITLMTCHVFKSARIGSLTLSSAGLLLFLLLLIENYPDHNRSGRYHTRAFARNLLAGKEHDIIFSYGDNFSFPLWYTQEVEQVAPKATIVDLAYLSTPEYVINLLKQGEKGLKLTATPADIAFGAYAFTKVAGDADTVPLPLIDILRDLYSSKEGAPVIRHSKALIPGLSMNDTVILNLRSLANTSGMIPFRTLILLDIMATNLALPNPRPLSFLTHVKRDVLAPVKGLTRSEAFTETYAPAMTHEEYVKRLLTSAHAIDSTAVAHISQRPYTDPVIDDQIRRQRGGMTRIAHELQKAGYPDLARKVILRFPNLFPATSPGSYTVADSTFHETLDAAAILLTEGDSLAVARAKILLDRSRVEAAGWNRFYKSLPSWRRQAVSNYSKLLIITLPKIDSLRRQADFILSDSVACRLN